MLKKLFLAFLLSNQFCAAMQNNQQKKEFTPWQKITTIEDIKKYGFDGEIVAYYTETENQYFTPSSIYKIKARHSNLCTCFAHISKEQIQPVAAHWLHRPCILKESLLNAITQGYLSMINLFNNWDQEGYGMVRLIRHPKNFTPYNYPLGCTLNNFWLSKTNGLQMRNTTEKERQYLSQSITMKKVMFEYQTQHEGWLVQSDTTQQKKITKWTDAEYFAGHIVVYSTNDNYFKGACYNKNPGAKNYGYIRKKIYIPFSQENKDFGFEFLRLVINPKQPTNSCIISAANLKNNSNLFLRFATTEEVNDIRTSVLYGKNNNVKFEEINDKKYAEAIIDGTAPN